MTKKKGFKRWRQEYEQLLVNNTPLEINQLDQIKDVDLFDAWADGLTPHDALENGI